MIYFEGEPDADRVAIKFYETPKFVAFIEQIAPTAHIELGMNREPIAIVLDGFYSARTWPITKEHVERYGLEPYLDALRSIYKTYFDKNALFQGATMEVIYDEE